MLLLILVLLFYSTGISCDEKGFALLLRTILLWLFTYVSIYSSLLPYFRPLIHYATTHTVCFHSTLSTLLYLISSLRCGLDLAATAGRSHIPHPHPLSTIISHHIHQHLTSTSHIHKTTFEESTPSWFLSYIFLFSLLNPLLSPFPLASLLYGVEFELDNGVTVLYVLSGRYCTWVSRALDSYCHFLLSLAWLACRCAGSIV